MSVKRLSPIFNCPGNQEHQAAGTANPRLSNTGNSRAGQHRGCLDLNLRLRLDEGGNLHHGHGGKMTAVSRGLGLERSNLYRKMRALGIPLKE